MLRYSHYQEVGVVPSGLSGPYRCQICGTNVCVDKRGRSLAHRFLFRGLWGRIIINESCAGRGNRAIKE